MAKKRKSASRSRKIPVMGTIGAVATGLTIYEGYKNAGTDGLRYTATGIGEDGKFHMDRALSTYAPVIAGSVGSAIAAKMKLNRFIKLPFVKL